MCPSNWAKWVSQDRTSLHLGSWGGPAASVGILLWNQPTSRVLEQRQPGLCTGCQWVVPPRNTRVEWNRLAECAPLTWITTSPSTTAFVSSLLHEVTPLEHHQGSTGPALDLFFSSREALHGHRLLVCISLQTTFFSSGKSKLSPPFFFSKWGLSLKNWSSERNLLNTVKCLTCKA